MRNLVAISLFSLTAAPVVSLAAARAGASSWVVDRTQSSLGFEGSVSGSTFTGKFTKWDARIQFDPNALTQSSIVATIATSSAVTGDQNRDRALVGADWFAAQTFPRATFEARTFKPLGGNRYQAYGTLSIRSVKRPVSFPFQLELLGDRAHVRAIVPIDRRVFGVGQGQFSASDLVGATVRVLINLQAKRSA